MLQQRAAVADAGRELKQAVELQELDAGAVEDFAARHALECPLHGAVCARVAIVDRVCEQFPGAIQQGIVDAPAIHANRSGGVDFLDADRNFPPKPQNIPMEPLRGLHRDIGKTMDFAQRYGAAIKGQIHHPSRCCAQIYRRDVLFGHELI